MSTGCSIFLAGGEVTRLGEDLFRYGVKNVLFSYFYILMMRREATIARWMDEHPECNFFLDSGAYTYGVKYQEDPDRLPPIKQYLQRYFAYIEETGKRWCRITEPDMDIAGVPEHQVEVWRNQMLDYWPDLNITPTWHKTRGIDEWHRYCFDPRIKCLAIGSGDFGDIGLARRLIMLAQARGLPVHGFGMTRVNTVLKHLPLDSVDSSSWTMGQKAGTLYIFRANKFFTLQSNKRNERVKYRRYFENIGCDPALIIKDDLYEVRKANILAWRFLSERLEHIKRMGRQGYGLEQDIFLPSNAELPMKKFSPLTPNLGSARDSLTGLKEKPPKAARKPQATQAARQRTQGCTASAHPRLPANPHHAKPR